MKQLCSFGGRLVRAAISVGTIILGFIIVKVRKDERLTDKYIDLLEQP